MASIDRTQLSARLPRRDFILLPLLSLMTALVMVSVGEIGARLWMPEQQRDSCLVADPLLSQRPKPMCRSMTKSAEGAWVENRYNECGYRSDSSCQPLAADGLRMAVIGSSASWGYHVRTEYTWYVRAGLALAARCQRPVDVQNLSGLFSLAQIAARTPEVLALDPRLVVMILTPWDIQAIPLSGAFSPAEPQTGGGAAAPDLGLMETVKGYISSARIVELFQHFLLRQPDSFLPLYLQYGDKADYLRPPFTPAWSKRLAYADQAIGYLSGAFAKAGIPLVIVFTPQQAQATIASGHYSFPGIDPFALGDALGEIARRHGVFYRDMTHQFAGVKDATAYYLNVDGHLNDEGDEMTATVVTDMVTAPGAPLAQCGLGADRP